MQILALKLSTRLFRTILLITVAIVLALAVLPTPKSSAATPCAVITSGTNLSYSALESCGYPTPNTTGVPAGTNLTTVSSLSCTNKTVNAVYFVGNPDVGSNCTITNSRIIGNISLGSGISNVKLTNVELSGPYTGSPSSPNCTFSTSNGQDTVVHAMGDPAAITVDHGYLHCAAEPFNGNGIVKNSYILSDECWGPCGGSSTTHNEAIYIAGGNSASKPGSNIDHNTLLMPFNQTAGLFGDDHAFGPIHNLTVTNNFVASGGDLIDTGTPNNGNTNIVVKNNRLSRVYRENGPVGGQNPSPSVTTWCGNILDSSPTTYFDVNGGTNGAACPGGTGGGGTTTYDSADLATLLSHYGITNGMTTADGDIDGNGAVNVYDLSEMLMDYSP